MNNVIYKYRLGVEEHQVIELPKGAEVLHVNNQGEMICIWAHVDRLAKKERKEFIIYGTGHNCYPPLGWKHIGTVFVRDYVRHIYMEG